MDRGDAGAVSEVVTSNLLLSNLHCPSCVANIEKTLNALQPRPLSVSASIVTSWVTVRHLSSLTFAQIQTALEDAGFDVFSVIEDGVTRDTPRWSDADDGLLEGYLSQPSRIWNRRTKSSRTAELMKERHLKDCDLCRAEGYHDGDHKDATARTVHSISGDASSELQNENEKISLNETIPDERSVRQRVDAPFVVIDDPSAKQDLWRASLAIGGMTCASCSNTIIQELEKKDWVRKAVVNLISNSAAVDFVGKDHASDLVEAIEDIGYEATIDNVTDMSKVDEKIPRRTVLLEVAGVYCAHCPPRILRSISIFNDAIRIEKPLTLEDPILKISYVPESPRFTIRQILAALSSVDPKLEISIYHPPTLEQRSEMLLVKERHRLLIRLALTVVVAIPTFIIGIVLMSLVSSTNSARQYLMEPMAVGVSRAQWALFIMATPIYFLAADLFHRRALKEIRSMWRPGSKTPILQRFYRFGSMNMLMSLGTSIAYISSVAQLISSGVHRPSMVDNNSFYFDSVVFLTLFLLIGRIIEAYSKSKTGDAVAMLGKLRPTEALLLNENGQTSDVNVDMLDLGDTVRVLHGASPPSDGIVIQGETTFDESSLTGESKLVKKSVGGEVFAGTVNQGAPISVKIRGVAGSSMLDQIVKAVREGQTKRAPIEKIADTLTSYFVPAITLLAVVTWLIWLGLGLSGRLPSDYLSTDSGGWTAWSLQFAIAVFVVACPCGLALAAPTALFVGGGLAAQHGILVKGGGEAFEKASRLDCIVFDKTGTLTLGGEPVVTDHWVYLSNRQSDMSEAKLLSMVQSLEENSSHTVAKAIVSFCKGQNLEACESNAVEEIAGRGMKGTVTMNGLLKTEMIIGNENLMTDFGVHISDEISLTLESWKVEGRSIALAAIREGSWTLAAAFAISDPVRPEAKSVIEALKKRGTAVWMLSGDNISTARAIGAQVSIPDTNIIAGVLPSQKSDKIRELQSSLKARTFKGRELSHRRALIAMVGDGINDSPALTTADVGIAIGSGSDIAISSAEFVLVSSNLESMITLLDLSRTVFLRIKFNFGWALVYNLLAVPVAAGCLYAIVSNGSHVRLDPVWASLAMAASSISVVCSSLALRTKIPVLGFVDKRKSK